jgi:hypothetical protein
MKLQGYLSEVGQHTSGINQATGKEWTCRALSFLVPYYTERGEEKYDNIVADYFGEATDEELIYMVNNRTKLNFTIAFSTRTHNDRRYQSARVLNLSAIV